MENKISFFGKEYAVDDAIKKMNGHLSWFFWIAGLSLINLIYAILDQDYFMVAGLGLDSVLAGYISTSEEQFNSIQLYLGFAFVAFFLVSGCWARTNNIFAVGIATAIYAVDTVIFATYYFDFVSLLFHLWATVSLIIGGVLMSKLNRVSQPGEAAGEAT